ncbi:glycosyl transferase [Fervidobacterium riparium]|nr:glycosyl transferase [Fervidobacterium riparium]
MDKIILDTFFAVIVTLFFIALSRKTKILLEYPDKRKNHSKPVPLVGGLVLYTWVIYKSGNGWSLTESLPVHLAFAIGLIDDLLEIPYYAKLFFQFLLGFFFIQSTHFSLFGNVVVDKILTFLFFVALMNAFNLIDGINGLLLTVSIIYFSFTLNFSMLLVLAILLIFNMAEKLFMGDSGAFLTAYLLLSSDRLPNEAIKIGVFFGYPLYEIASSFLRRLVFKQNPFKPDRFHLHHIGSKLFGHTYFLIIAAFLTIGFCRLSSKEFGLVFYVAISLLIFAFQIKSIRKFRNLDKVESVSERDESDLKL